MMRIVALGGWTAVSWKREVGLQTIDITPHWLASSSNLVTGFPIKCGRTRPSKRLVAISTSGYDLTQHSIEDGAGDFSLNLIQPHPTSSKEPLELPGTVSHVAIASSFNPESTMILS